MTLEIWFWIVMAVWFFFGLWRERGNANFPLWLGGHIVEFLLFIIVGWRVFGSPVK